MATINFVDGNNNAGQVYSFSHQVAPWCLVGCDQNGTKHYIPTDGAEYTAYDEDMGSYINRYSYSSSSPSLHAAIESNVATDVINAYNTVSVINKYDIPAGTYTPSAFESLVSAFIGYNSSRKVQDAYQVTVNGQTVQCAANSYISLQKCYKSPYSAQPHAVWFNRRNTTGLATTPPEFYLNSNTGFTSGNCYVTYFNTSSLDRYSEQSFNNYAQFPITVTTGIKFV